MVDIIDRRLNSGGKALPNRKRFLDRALPEVRRAVNAGASQRGLTDSGDGNLDRVKISGQGTSEPSFRHGKAGQRDFVLPGNREFAPKDEIPLPQGGQGGGGSKAGKGQGLDEFEFVLTRQEMMDALLEGLELPNLELRTSGDVPESKPQRAGLSVSGTPSSLNLGHTMRKSLERRVALGQSKRAEIDALHAAIAAAVAERDIAALTRLRAELQALVSRVSTVPFLDPLDLRYNRFERKPLPRAKAVMFCLMDVSGSMSEKKKEFAKRFFLLTYRFLERQYKEVSLVFIRHTDSAEEVDENTFFYDKTTGGTMVSPALEEMARIQQERFPLADWNIYAIHASDGDNGWNDEATVISLMREKILPVVQMFAYVEVQPSSEFFTAQTQLWRAYETVAAGSGGRMTKQRIAEMGDVMTRFRELFRPRVKAA